MVPKGAGAVCGIERSFRRLLQGTPPAMDWRRFFGRDYRSAERQAVLCSGLAQANVTAWVNAMDVFNDWLLQALFRRDKALGGVYTVGKLGSMMHQGNFRASYPAVQALVVEVHEKRGESSLSHPVKKKGAVIVKRAGLIRYGYIFRAKKYVHAPPGGPTPAAGRPSRAVCRVCRAGVPAARPRRPGGAGAHRPAPRPHARRGRHAGRPRALRRGLRGPRAVAAQHLRHLPPGPCRRRWRASKRTRGTTWLGTAGGRARYCSPSPPGPAGARSNSPADRTVNNDDTLTFTGDGITTGGSVLRGGASVAGEDRPPPGPVQPGGRGDSSTYSRPGLFGSAMSRFRRRHSATTPARAGSSSDAPSGHSM
jgi:hypothetical protein